MKKILLAMFVLTSVLVACIPVRKANLQPTNIPVVTGTPDPITFTVTPAISIYTANIATTTLVRNYSSDLLPVKSWPDLEQYYACDPGERKADKWYFANLSLPMEEGEGYERTSDWVVARTDQTYTIVFDQNVLEKVFEVRSVDYSVQVPEGSGVYKINFTTKSCDVDWLYVILPRDRNPLDFKIIVTIKPFDEN